jgi:hypothetical protein
VNNKARELWLSFGRPVLRGMFIELSLVARPSYLDECSKLTLATTVEGAATSVHLRNLSGTASIRGSDQNRSFGRQVANAKVPNGPPLAQAIKWSNRPESPTRFQASCHYSACLSTPVPTSARRFWIIRLRILWVTIIRIMIPRLEYVYP